MIVDGWLLAQGGHGIANFARTLVEGLARSDSRERVAVAVPSGVESTVPDGVKTVSVPDRFNRLDVLREAVWQERLGRFVRARHPDEAFLAPSLFLSSAALPRSVVVCHDVIPLKFPRYLGRFLYRRWLFLGRLRWLRQASFVVTDSEFTRRELLEYLGDAAPSTVTIPLWTPMADSAAPTIEQQRAVQARYGLPPRYWLYVGGYDYRKNVELLIEAFGRVARSNSCPPLVLAGRIPVNLSKPVCDVAGALRKAAVPDERICRPGFIAADDLPALYAGAELFIYPSLSEGFGLPPVEAMSCGCPAIVADSSSLPEVVTDADYRFTTRDATSLADMLAAAVRTRRPFNPGFDRAFFGQTRGLRDYLRVMASVT